VERSILSFDEVNQEEWLSLYEIELWFGDRRRGKNFLKLIGSSLLGSIVVRVKAHSRRAFRSDHYGRGSQEGCDLLVVERRFRQVGRYLQQTDEIVDSVLQSKVNDIDPERRRRITDILASMLDEINQIKGLFNLEVAHESLRWHIVATLGEIRNILEDLKPEKVTRASGHMSEDVEYAWRPHITKSSNMLYDLYQELGWISLHLSVTR